jgi:CBS domain-containing protein
MTIVADILKTKAEQSVHTVGPAVPALDAAQTMARKNIGGLLVVDGGQIVGIVTERDYARKLVPMGRSPKDTPVREIMSSPVMYVTPQHTSGQCMALMTENRLRHLPVVDGGQLVGLVSIGDLVKDIISDQQFTIEQLQHYISGQR